MNKKNKKVWFKEGKAWVCYACSYPYNKENKIGPIKVEDWMKMETLEQNIE